MQSKNKKAPTADEKKHIERVKLLPCSVCDEGGGEASPSECHEIKQGDWWTAIALCTSCHRGAMMGWHGLRRAWIMRKMDLIDALSVTIRRLMTGKL